MGRNVILSFPLRVFGSRWVTGLCEKAAVTPRWGHFCPDSRRNSLPVCYCFFVKVRRDGGENEHANVGFPWTTRRQLLEPDIAWLVCFVQFTWKRVPIEGLDRFEIIRAGSSDCRHLEASRGSGEARDDGDSSPSPIAAANGSIPVDYVTSGGEV